MISFVLGTNHTLVLVDLDGRLVEFTLTIQDTADTATDRERSITTLKEKQLGKPFWCNISEAGRTLAYHHQEGTEFATVFRITPSEVLSCTLLCETDSYKAPIVSANGKSVLVCSVLLHCTTSNPCKPVVRVWPKIEFTESESEGLVLDGDRAVWD